MATKATVTEAAVSIAPLKFEVAEFCLIGTAPLVINKFSEKARNLMLHASVRGNGSVSASVKAQGSNTPDIEQSWVDIGLSVTASGNTQATAWAEGSCEFAYVRQVLTAMSGVEVVSSISSK